jgi:hypothetical protein
MPGTYPVTAAAGTAWAFTRLEKFYCPSARAVESGAALTRSIGLELPDAAVVASIPGGH